MQNPEQREASQDKRSKSLRRRLVSIAVALGLGGIALAGCAPETSANEPTTANNNPDTSLPSAVVNTTPGEVAEPTATSAEFQTTPTVITQESVVKKFKEIENGLPTEQQAEFSQETQALIQELTEKQIIGPVQDPDNLVVDVLANGQPAVMLREYNDASGNILNQYFCVIRGENGFMVATLEGAQQFIKDQGLAGQATSLRFGNAGEPLILALDASGRIVAAVNGKSAGETAFQWVRADQAVAEYPESEVAINDAELPAGFPTELLSSLHRIETTPDGGQIAYGVGGTNNSEFILLFKAAGQTDWQSAPYGIGLPEDDESPGIIRRLSKDEQGNYSWGRIPVTEYGNIQEIAKTGELLLEMAEDTDRPEKEFSSLYGKETTLNMEIDQQVSQEMYKEFLQAYIDSDYLKKINYWQENNIGPFNSVDEFETWLADHDWKLPKFQFVTGRATEGIGGRYLTEVQFSNVDFSSIELFFLTEDDYKSNIFMRSLYEAITKNKTFWGNDHNTGALGFTVIDGKIVFIVADTNKDIFRQNGPEFLEQTFQDDPAENARVASAWLKWAIISLQKTEMFDDRNFINVAITDKVYPTSGWPPYTTLDQVTRTIITTTPSTK